MLKNSLNKNESKDFRIGTFPTKFIFSRFDDNINILNNGLDGLALSFESYLWRNSYFDNYLKQLFFV